ncbi:MAG: IclR family transcriptional regulator [Salinisphaeraceae bacterium]
MSDAAKSDLHDRYFVPGLHRGLALLEVFGRLARPLSASEAARELGISRSAAFRTVYTLAHMGFLEETEGGRAYRLGSRVLNLGFAYLSSQNLVELARPDLEALRDETGISSHLAIRDGRDVLFLDCVQTRTGFLSNMNVGARRPAHGSPMGWLMLADLDEADLRALYDGEAMMPLTGLTPTTLPALRRAIDRANRDGFVMSHGIAEAGGQSVSAPVRDRSGRVVAAIDISGPVSAFDLARPEADYIEWTRVAARRISAKLGHSG